MHHKHISLLKLCLVGILTTTLPLYATSTDGEYSQRHVILQKGKSFAEQVTKPHTTYEIRHDYRLSASDITVLPENCVLEFRGGKLMGGSLNYGNTQIIAPEECVIEKTNIQHCTTNQRINAAWFGFSPKGNTNTAILQALIDNFSYIYIAPGEYKMNGRIHIKPDSNIVDIECEKSEQGRAFTNLTFPASDGFLVEKRVFITGLSVTGARGKWNTTTQQYEGGYTGFDLRRACVMSFINVREFAIGIDTYNGMIISGKFEKIVFEKCGNYGFRFVSDSERGASNIANIIQDCYFVNIGKDGLVEGTKSTGKKSGIGMYVLGGSGNAIFHNVFEYCSGIGLFIDRPTKNSVMRNYNITANFFEYNKYANFFVDINTGNSALIKGFFSQGNSYSDANRKLAPDACGNRACVIQDLYGQVFNGNLIIDDVDASISYRLCKGKLFSVDLLSKYNSEWEFYDKKSGNVKLEYGSASSEIRFIRGIYGKGVYRIFANVRYSGSSSGRVLSLHAKIGDDKISFSGIIPKSNKFELIQLGKVLTITENGTEVQVLDFSMTSSSKGDLMEIKCFYLEPVLSVTTSERNAMKVEKGFCIYDESLSKMVLYNGKAWTNLDGTTLK